MGSSADLTSDREPATLTTGELLREYLAEHLFRMERQEPRVREDAPESVHKMRICARRLRSALATYRPVLEAGSGDDLRGELRWLGGVLAQSRDAQVMRERFDTLVQAQPEELQMGPAATFLHEELERRQRVGRAEAVTALDSERYRRLLCDMRAFVDRPPYTEDAGRPARRMLPKLLQRDWKRLSKRVRTVEKAPTPEERDPALHEVRKAAKRLRYAAESATPVLGKRAEQLAALAKRVQEVLGEHQDTVVARSTLRTLAARAGRKVETGFGLGRLDALEEARAAELAGQYPDLVGSFPSTKLKSWLKG